jgi:hypothetical protein
MMGRQQRQMMPYLANAAGAKPPNHLIAVGLPLAQGAVKIGQGFSKRPPGGGFTRLDCAATDGTVEFEIERPLAFGRRPC